VLRARRSAHAFTLETKLTMLSGTCIDSQTTDALLEELQLRVARMAQYYARASRLDRDDLQQEAWLALLEALRDFDPALGELRSFLIQRARWRMLDTVKYTRVRICLSLPEEDGALGPVAHADETGAELAEFASLLSPLQQQILRCLLNGLTWRDTGAQLGFSSANVAYHVREIRRRYEQWNSAQSNECSFSAGVAQIEVVTKG
jgi:RNA polymerase sigma factor (sigma-70 family)